MSTEIPEKELLVVKERLENFLKIEVKKANTKGVIIGLSGGLDSSVVATLCAKALGPERVFGVSCYAEGYTKPEEIIYAKKIANYLKINHEIIDISQIVRNFKEKIPEVRNDDLGCVWLIPRIRTSIISTKANINNWVPISSINKSEAELGIFMWCGDIGLCCPLLFLYKTEVRALSKLLKIPEVIIKRNPCDGFLNGLEDKEIFNIDYNLLDKILYQLDLGCDSENISKNIGCSIMLVKSIINRKNKMKYSIVNRPKQSFLFVQSSDLPRDKYLK